MRLIRLLKNDLARESATWVEQGLISREQAVSICEVYGADYDQANRMAGGYRVLVVLGYVFIGLALITLLSANWDNLPRGLRMAGLLVTTVAVNGYAVLLYHRGRDRAAERLFLLGGLLYGASIILIAQIYHLGEHMPDGVFWWALGSAPAAVLLRSPLLGLLTLTLALIWFFIELQLGYFAWLFAGFVLLGVYILWVGRRSVLLFLLVVGSIGLWLEAALSVYWADATSRLSLHAEQLPVGVAYFILAYAVSHWLDKHSSSTARDYAALLSLWTLRFALICLFILSYHEPWREAIESDWDNALSMWAVVGVLSLVAVAIASRVGRALSVAAVALACGVVFALVAGFDDTGYAVYLQVVANLVLVGLGIALVAHGVERGESQAFFLGIASILLLALLRYIDLIGDYVGTAVLFIVIAAVLLGAARYWRSRRSVGEEQ